MSAEEPVVFYLFVNGEKKTVEFPSNVKMEQVAQDLGLAQPLCRLADPSDPGSEQIELSSSLPLSAIAPTTSPQSRFPLFGDRRAGGSGPFEKPVQTDQQSARGSPPTERTRSQTSGDTVAMTDDKTAVTIRYPNTQHHFTVTEFCAGIAEIQPKLDEAARNVDFSEDVVDFIIFNSVGPALQLSASCLQSNEAGIVKVVGLLVDTVALLLRGEFVSKLNIGNGEGDHQEAALQHDNTIILAAEKSIHVKGHIRGRIEIQHLTLDGKFVGAVEVGQSLTYNTLSKKVEQAKKEALSMWFFNASQKSYGPVWVLLTDGIFVVRIEYEGLNAPGNKHAKPIVQKMRSDDVRGHFRCTHGSQLWSHLPRSEATSDSRDAFTIIASGFVQPGPAPSLQALQEALEKRNKAASARRNTFVQSSKEEQDRVECQRRYQLQPLN